ncbi:hypothetical protein P8452_47144 [Trifolium repens]|nr:hypothetical protein P8452_47144 [Trifolium repens]
MAFAVCGGLLPVLDIKNLKDPEEFFAAHEQFENAKREIEKQLNRKYQPKVPLQQSVSIVFTCTFFVTLILILLTILIVAGSSPTEENKINDILQGLLTCDSKELEGDGAMNLLQERLQIGHAAKQLDSLTPPRSPFASLSSLQKHISLSKPSLDPFSAHEIDHIPTRNYSSTHMINQEVDILSSCKPSDEVSAPIIKDVIAARETNTIMETTENSNEDNSRKSLGKVNAPIIEDIVAVSETSSVDDPDRNCTSTPQKSMVDNSREPGFNANVDSNEPPVGMDEDIGLSGMGKRVTNDTVGRQNIEPNEPYQFEDKMLAENMQKCTASVPTYDASFNSVILLVANQANSMDKRSITIRSDDGPEQCLQKKMLLSLRLFYLLNVCLSSYSQAMVIKTKSVKYMLFWLSVANFLNSCCWTTYALIHPFDIYVLAINGIGAISGLIQLLLYSYYWF